jgi:hypothetical protein
MNYLAPIDPESTGTWIAVNQAGLAMCILNRTAIHSAPHIKYRKSRGSIIPSLIAAKDLNQAVKLVHRLAADNFASFCLIICDGSVVSEISNVQGVLKTRQQSAFVKPLLFTSSGLGDHFVEARRRKLFEALVARLGTPETQDAFHRHYWPDRRHVSVMMRRADASTVSVTQVILEQERSHMNYYSCNETTLLAVSSHTFEHHPCQQFRLTS